MFQQGASPDTINSLPTVVIGPETARNSSNGGQCPICLNDMNVGEVARSLRCQHLFHKDVSVSLSADSARGRLVFPHLGFVPVLCIVRGRVAESECELPHLSQAHSR